MNLNLEGLEMTQEQFDKIDKESQDILMDNEAPLNNIVKCSIDGYDFLKFSEKYEREHLTATELQKKMHEYSRKNNIGVVKEEDKLTLIMKFLDGENFINQYDRMILGYISRSSTYLERVRFVYNTTFTINCIRHNEFFATLEKCKMNNHSSMVIENSDLSYIETCDKSNLWKLNHMYNTKLPISIKLTFDDEMKEYLKSIGLEYVG